MINMKPGVTFHADTFKDYRIARIFWIAEQEAPAGYSPTVTSGGDGQHSTKSLHYKGRAIDLRTRDFPATPKTWADRMQRVLGSYYRVLVESDHIHIGYHGPR